MEKNKKMEIITHIINFPADSREARVLHGASATSCDTSFDTCGQFKLSGRQVLKDVLGSTNFDNIEIGKCKITGYACLAMARKVTSSLK